MPYIQPHAKEQLNYHLDPLKSLILNRGELNYCITKLILGQLPPVDEWNYATLSSLRAVLHDVSDEYFRRVLKPYEDAKRDANGDVYPPVPWVEDETIPYES